MATTQEGFIGIRERNILISESVYGTAPALTNAWVPGYDVVVTPNFTQGFQEILSAGSDSRTVNSRIAGPLSLPYTMEYTPANWRMLKYMFDIDSETGSDPYTHTLSVGDTQESFTHEWAMRHSADPLVYKMVGSVVNRFTIRFSKTSSEGSEAFVKCNLDIFAKDYTTPSSADAGSFTASGDPFKYHHLTLTLNSGEVVPINNGEITFSQGFALNDSRYANSALGRTIGQPIATIFRISGRFNLNLFATTYSTLWEAAAAIGGTNTIVFSQSASNKVTFTLSGVYCEPVPTGGTNFEGVNTGDFVFTATGVAVVCVDSIANW